MTRGLRTLVLGALVISAWPGEADSFVLVHSRGGAQAQWHTRCVDIWLNDAVIDDVTRADASAAFAAATAPWNAVDCTYVSLRSPGVTCFDAVGLADWPGPQNVVSWRDQDRPWDHPTRVVALTSLTLDQETGEIVDADVEINGEDYGFAVDGATDRYDLQQALTHELGHVLGLDHSDAVDATMFALSHAGETDKRTLSDDDIDGLCTGHPLRATPAITCGALETPTPFDAPWCPAEPERGCMASPPSAPGFAAFGVVMWLFIRTRRGPRSLG